jgi:hypothetical protein
MIPQKIIVLETLSKESHTVTKNYPQRPLKDRLSKEGKDSSKWGEDDPELLSCHGKCFTCLSCN